MLNFRNRSRLRAAGVLALVLASSLLPAQDRGYRDTARAHRGEVRGSLFALKQYTPTTLPRWEEIRGSLPSPRFDENPLWVEMYWRAWELAFRNFHEPAPGSGFVSQFIDAAFNENIFLWDTAFMTMFCVVASPLVPGIGSLDNFYAKQHVTGEICREIQRQTGRDFVFWANLEDTTLFSRWSWRWPGSSAPAWVEYRGRTIPRPNPHLTLDALNHPILAWAELESFRYTGDRARLSLVRDPLVLYYEALRHYLRQGNGLYITDWASMDDSPRNPALDRGGTGIDISSEMVLFARNLATIDSLLGREEGGRRFALQADTLAGLVNALMWNGERGFYFDLTLDGHQAGVKTIAGFWPLLARIPDDRRAGRLVEELRNPDSFWRRHPVPSTPADERGFDGRGAYWRGGVWAPTNTMVIRGLEAYGKDDVAREIALRHLEALGEVYRTTGTLWECYAPDSLVPGMTEPGRRVARDFVGWTGLGPILYLLEHAIGLRPDAPRNTLTWNLASRQPMGVERYRFNGHLVTLFAPTPGKGPGYRRVLVESSGEFALVLCTEGERISVRVGRGKNEFMVPD
jgi:hypothetical protein